MCISYTTTVAGAQIHAALTYHCTQLPPIPKLRYI